MLCQSCGSDVFDEENGLFFCSYCQTQSQGFLQESEQTFVDISKMGREVTKKRVKPKTEQKKTGVLWTTTEAFNIILYKQMNAIFEINDNSIDMEDYKSLTLVLWISYLRKSGQLWTEGETKDGPVTRRLHPAARFRDQQILTNRVDKCLPPYKNGSTALGFTNVFKLGSDGVIRTVEEMEALEELDLKRTEKEKTNDLNDVFDERYRDPRNYCKYKSKELKISRKSTKILHKILSQIDLKLSLETTIDLIDAKNNIECLTTTSDSNSDVDEEVKESVTEVVISSPKSDNLSKSSESSGNNDDFERELIRNATDSTKLFLNYIPLSYLQDSRNNCSEYFMDLMSLPKTISFLNIVNRVLRTDIYLFDLIRWINEWRIPYKNCLVCLPQDFLIIPNDLHTFTAKCVPSLKRINILSAKIMSYIGVKSYPRPNLYKLMDRFLKDLNLPKDIRYIIETNFNIFTHFKQLERMANKCSRMTKMPFYEGWTLMAVILILKRIFILNDSTEKRLSTSAKDSDNVFIWNDWETYSRLRLELIRSYFIPIHSRNFEDIRDIDLIAEHSLKRTESDSTKSFPQKTKIFDRFDFRVEAQQEFQELVSEEPESQLSDGIIPSLYPLTNATNFALKRTKSSTITEKMSVSFEDKETLQWMCSHGNTFHRGYQFLEKDLRQWSSSFRLLMEFSTILLHCRYEKLIPIIREMERNYFGLKSNQ